MYLTVGPFAHRLAPGETEFVQLEPEMIAGDKRGPLKDLVMRFTGPGKLIASGHALRPPLPTNVGLATSTDAAATWSPLSGFDEADYHEVEVSKDQIVGLRSDSRGVRISRDGGKTFETREPPGDTPPIDAATSPADVT